MRRLPALLLLFALACSFACPPMAAAAPGIDPSLYRIEVQRLDLGPELQPLQQAIDAWTRARREAFLHELETPGSAEFARRTPWTLNLDFRLDARTADFAQVTASGAEWTGGAHPNPILDGFAYDLHTRRLLALADLFDDFPAAEAALAAAARRQLEQRLQEGLPSTKEMVEDGIATGQGHFRIFSFVPGADGRSRGLKLIFPVYQVAAYVAGPQTLTVPSSVFTAWLKPAYRNAFR